MNDIVTIGDATLYTGCSQTILASLPENSVQTCITSPPYFGLRDYGHDGQLGREPTPDEFVAALVEVFREVRRVLRDDGTVWLNLGDSYAANRGYQVPDSKHIDVGNGVGMKASVFGLKPKDLIGIPWRVAFALQADGWYLRQDIIWHKPNPMPESVRDRCTKAHEYIFLLSKSARYYFDAEAIKEDTKTNDKIKGQGRGVPDRVKGDNGLVCGYGTTPGKRNKRSVWTVTPKPYKGAHFATFPPDLITPCVLAGAPVGGVVLDPFSGSGTTGQVALQQGRKYVGIELNPEYQKLACERIEAAYAQGRLFA